MKEALFIMILLKLYKDYTKAVTRFNLHGNHVASFDGFMKYMETNMIQETME